MSKISIKEAGRYANFLEQMLTSLIDLVLYNGIDSKMIKVVENHKKSEAYKEASDELIEVEHADDIDVEIDVLTKTIESLVQEKAQLAEAIAEAKKNIAIKVGDNPNMNLDSAIEYAKLLRRISRNYFAQFINKKESKRKVEKKAYAFNVEGNQAPYYYEVEVETTLIYDKDGFIKKDKENKLLADKISDKIEKAMSSEAVDFVPKYSYLDDINDVIGQSVIAGE